MSYLAKLKVVLATQKNQSRRVNELTKLPEPYSVSFVSPVSGAAGKFLLERNVIASSAALQDEDIERAAIVEHDAKVPREWAEGYAWLLGLRVPADVEPVRWQTFLDDCGWFLDRWAVKAEALGWRSADLFGPAREPISRTDLAGLCWLLQGRELVALTDSTAVIREASGAILRYYRHERGSEQLLAWEIQSDI